MVNIPTGSNARRYEKLQNHVQSTREAKTMEFKVSNSKGL